MKQRPGASELERLANQILRDEPLDRQARGYEQRMAARALSIAHYDRARGESDMVEEMRLFEALYGVDDAGGLGALNRRLAGEIREGMWDEAPPRLWNLLMAQARARLRRVNPKYLKARDETVD